MPFIMLFKDVDFALMWLTVILVILSGYNFSLFLRAFGLKEKKQ